MDTTGITPVMPIGNESEGGFWIFALLILAMMSGNGFGGFGNNGNSNAIQNDVNRGFDNQNLQNQTRDILSSVNAGTAQSVAATNQTFHDTLVANQNMYNELARDIAAIGVGQANALANQNACCCETKMLIQQSAADNALLMAQMEARIMAKMDANEIQSLRDKIGSLELRQATDGMLRFPNQWTFGAGFFPPLPAPPTTTTSSGTGA